MKRQTHARSPWSFVTARKCMFEHIQQKFLQDLTTLTRFVSPVHRSEARHDVNVCGSIPCRSFEEQVTRRNTIDSSIMKSCLISHLFVEFRERILRSQARCIPILYRKHIRRVGCLRDRRRWLRIVLLDRWWRLSIVKSWLRL